MSYYFNQFGEVQEYVGGKPFGSPRPSTDLEDSQRNEIEELNKNICKLEESIFILEEKVSKLIDENRVLKEYAADIKVRDW